MKLGTAFARTGIAAVALTAMGLVAAAPASAHTNNMYTYLYYDAVTDSSSYATYDKSTGVATPLETLFDPNDEDVLGIEVANEIGTEIGYSDGPYVLDWNHTTGAIGTYLDAFVNGVSEWEFWALDTLNDGTTVTILNYEVNEGSEEEPDFQQHWAVASVNRTTGELVPLVDFTDEVWDSEQEYNFYVPRSLATDPATGITYVFLQGEDDHDLLFLPITVGSTTVGEPTLFEDEYLEHGDWAGADFDAGDGNLYIHFNAHDEGPWQLLRLGAPSTWPTAVPTYISTAPADVDTQEVALLALTIEHFVLANTGTELPVLAIVLVGTVAVVAGGATLMVARRRAEAGTV